MYNLTDVHMVTTLVQPAPRSTQNIPVPHKPLSCSRWLLCHPQGSRERLMVPVVMLDRSGVTCVFVCDWLALLSSASGDLPHACVCGVWLVFTPLCSFCCGRTVSRFWLTYNCNVEHFLHVPSLTCVCISHTYRPRCGISRLKTVGIFTFSSYCLACF